MTWTRVALKLLTLRHRLALCITKTVIVAQVCAQLVAFIVLLLGVSSPLLQLWLIWIYWV